MTAEMLLVLLLLAGGLVATGLVALILSAFGPAGWLLVVALVVAGVLAWCFVAARVTWSEDLQDDWRAG